MFFVVACSKCQVRLTGRRFTRYLDAQEAAAAFGVPLGDSDSVLCSKCAGIEPDDWAALSVGSSELDPVAG